MFINYERNTEVSEIRLTLPDMQASFLALEAERCAVSEADIVSFALSVLAHYRHATTDGHSVVVLEAPIDEPDPDVGLAFYASTMADQRIDATRPTESFLLSLRRSAETPEQPRLRVVTD